MRILKPKGSTAIKRSYREILSHLEAVCSPERVRHSRNVAELAAALCTRCGLPPALGRLAGISHDLSREYSDERVGSLVRRYRVRAGKWEREHPVVLHGKLGAVLLKRRFGVRDRRVLAAVRDHVLGRPRMSRLAKILYVSDFLEPGRGFLEDAERRRLAALPLDRAILRVTEAIFAYLDAGGKAIAPVTKKMYDRLAARAAAGDPPHQTNGAGKE